MPSKKRKQNATKSGEGKKSDSDILAGGSSSNSTPSTSASLLPLTVFAVLSSLTLYGNTCENEFVYDDLVAVVQNPDVRAERPISELFRDDFWGAILSSSGSHKSYRPITTLAYRLTASWAGMEPKAFHIVNSFVNAMTVGLAAKCIDIVSRDVQGMSSSKDHPRIFGMPTFQVIATALYVFHPIHTESVNGIVGLADLLAAAFGFLVFIFHDMSMSNASKGVALQPFYLCICLVLSWMAALSKETGLMILAICGAREITRYWLPRLGRKGNCSVKASIIRFTCLASTGVAFLVFRKIINGENTGIVLGDSICDNPLVTAESTLNYVLSALLVLSIYLWKLINLFAPLICDWGYDSIPLVEGWNDLRNVATLAAFTGTTVATLIGIQKAVDKHNSDGRVLMGLAWIIGPLFPASHIFTIGTVLAERLLLVPSFGYSILVGVFIERFQLSSSQKKRSTGGNNQAAVIPCLVVVLAVLAQRILARNADWKDNRTLWNRDFQTNPSNVKLAKAYASELELAGKLDEAFYVIKDMTGLGPYQRVEVCLVKSRVTAMSAAAGRNYDLGHRILDECIAEVEALPKMTTNSHQLYGSKAYLFHYQGKIKEAVPFFEKAAFVAEKTDKRNLQPVCNVGEIYGAVNRWEEAVGHLERCVAWGERAREVKERRAPALANLGVAYMRTGQYAKASAALKKSITLHQTDQAIKNLHELQKHLEKQNKSSGIGPKDGE